MTVPGLPGVLDWRAGVQPERTALEVHGVASLTFSGWERRSRTAAAGLARHLAGRTPVRGARIGLVFSGRDWVDLAVAYLAVQRAGAVAVPLSDRLAPPQLVQRLVHCRAALVVHGPGTDPPAGLPAPAVALADLEAAPSEPSDASGEPAFTGADVAQILYTSGTTGAPRAVTATHDNLVPAFRWDLRRLPLGHSDVLVHAFAVGTNAGQTMLANALLARPTVLTPAAPTPARFARLIESSRAGTVFLVPSTAVELLRSGALDGRDLTAVRLVGCTAAALPAAVAVELAGTFPRASVVNYYTSTEAAPATATMIFDPARPECVGRAPSGSLRVCDREGRVLPPGEVGEVWLRAPHARSYLRDPAADRTTFGADGWVRMGDLGRLDGEGYLHLTGREGDVIKSGAFKVSPLEVESALFTVPGVADAAVVGLPDPVLGAVLGAVVVPRPTADGDRLTLAVVRAALLDRLSDHELPTRLAVVDRLPRNDGGKVLKHELVPLFPAHGTDPPRTDAPRSDAPRTEGHAADVRSRI